MPPHAPARPPRATSPPARGFCGVRRAVLSALCLLAAAPATAAAAPPWSAPQDQSGPHLFIDGPRLAVAGDGAVALGWTWQDGIGNAAHFGVHRAALAAGATAAGSAGALPAATAAGPVVAGTTRTAIATLTEPRDPTTGTWRIGVAFGRLTGGYGAVRTVTAQRVRLVGPQLAAAPDGAMALAWWEDRGTANDRVMVSLRRPGGSFGAPTRLATGRIRSVSVAIGARGDVLVAWDARGTVQARVKAAGRGFASTDTIASEDAYSADLRTAVSARGRPVVAWRAQFRSEGGTSGPAYVQAAVRPLGKDRFRPAELLERTDATRARPGIGLALDAAGAPVVAWTGADATGPRVRVARSTSSLRFAAPQDVSAAGLEVQLADLAADAGGRLAAIWTVDTFERTSRVQAAVAPPGGALGAPEDVSPTGAEAYEPRIAFAGAGPAVALYAARPRGEARPVQTFAQLALRR